MYIDGVISVIMVLLAVILILVLFIMVCVVLICSLTLLAYIIRKADFGGYIREINNDNVNKQ